MFSSETDRMSQGTGRECPEPLGQLDASLFCWRQLYLTSRARPPVVSLNPSRNPRAVLSPDRQWCSE